MHCFCILSSLNTSLHWWCGCPIVKHWTLGNAFQLWAAAGSMCCVFVQDMSLWLTVPWSTLQQKWVQVLLNCQRSLMKCRGIIYNGLASNLGRVKIYVLVVSLLHKNYDDVMLPLWGHPAQVLISVFLD